MFKALNQWGKPEATSRDLRDLVGGEAEEPTHHAFRRAASRFDGEDYPAKGRLEAETIDGILTMVSNSVGPPADGLFGRGVVFRKRQ